MDVWVNWNLYINNQLVKKTNPTFGDKTILESANKHKVVGVIWRPAMRQRDLQDQRHLWLWCAAAVVSGIFIVRVPSNYNVSCRATEPGLVGRLLKENKYGSGFTAPPWHTPEPKEEIKRNNRTFGRYCKMLFARKGMMCRPTTKTEAQPVWSSKPGGGDSVKTILSRMMTLEKTSLSNHYANGHPLPLIKIGSTLLRYPRRLHYLTLFSVLCPSCVTGVKSQLFLIIWLFRP